jgi:hypothetical protein
VELLGQNPSAESKANKFYEQLNVGESANPVDVIDLCRCGRRSTKKEIDSPKNPATVREF